MQRDANLVVLHAQPDTSVAFSCVVTRRCCQPQVPQGHDGRHLFGPWLALETLQQRDQQRQAWDFVLVGTQKIVIVEPLPHG